MEPHVTAHDADLDVRASYRRKRLIRSAGLLAAAVVALAVFVIVLGDWRRQARAVDQCRWHAAVLSARKGAGESLPLNLQPDPAPERVTVMFRLEWLDRSQAALLRDAGGRRVVAQTVPVRKLLGRDGRGVIFFDQGNFDVQWLALAEFDALAASQAADMRRRAKEAASGREGAP